jgi:myo-inositol-1(or 4)-monophosphatase
MKTEYNLQDICNQVINVAKKAGAFIKGERKNFTIDRVEVKSMNNLVSYVDKEAEKIIVENLMPLIENAGFITEEETIHQDKKEFNWVIDPLDGTTNFIHNIPCYAVSIALLKGNEILVGVVYEINMNECFYAWKNGGAYMNGEKIEVSKTPVLAQTLLATGFPYYDYRRLANYMGLFNDLMQSTRGVRRLGSAATDLVYTACGRFDAFYEYSLHIWDVAAGILIVLEAGGKVNDFKGGNNYLSGKELCASNGLIHNELLKKIGIYFK